MPLLEKQRNHFLLVIFCCQLKQSEIAITLPRHISFAFFCIRNLATSKHPLYEACCIVAYLICLLLFHLSTNHINMAIFYSHVKWSKIAMILTIHILFHFMKQFSFCCFVPSLKSLDLHPAKQANQNCIPLFCLPTFSNAKNRAVCLPNEIQTKLLNCF